MVDLTMAIWMKSPTQLQVPLKKSEVRVIDWIEAINRKAVQNIT